MINLIKYDFAFINFSKYKNFKDTSKIQYYSQAMCLSN